MLLHDDLLVGKARSSPGPDRRRPAAFTQHSAPTTANSVERALVAVAFVSRFSTGDAHDQWEFVSCPFVVSCLFVLS